LVRGKQERKKQPLNETFLLCAAAEKDFILARNQGLSPTKSVREISHVSCLGRASGGSIRDIKKTDKDGSVVNTTALVLNCFPVELSPTTFDVPFIEYSAWENSTKALREDYYGYLAYRYKTDDQQIRIVLLDGPQVPQALTLMAADVAELPSLAKKVIERSLADYMTARGLVSRRTGFETIVMKKTPDFSQGRINIFCGISFQVRRPFQANPYGFVISMKWEVTASFEQSLIDSILRAISIGMPVLYKPTAVTSKIPQELRRFRGRYLGRVREIRSDDEAVVSCKDDQLRRVALADLFLEASPAVIRAYERESGMKREVRSVWQKIQEFNFVLNATGRRNPSVLKDRLEAIRKFLGGGTREQLTLPLRYFGDGTISIGLSPMHVEVL
jgi:hypothetical protein